MIEILLLWDEDIVPPFHYVRDLHYLGLREQMTSVQEIHVSGYTRIWTWALDHIIRCYWTTTKVNYLSFSRQNYPVTSL
jgi:hypothetical protein